MSRVIYRNLRDELEAIASVELADVLASWGDWTPDQEERLASYLRAEMQPYGMLSIERARVCGSPLGRERQEARRLLEWLSGRGW